MATDVDVQFFSHLNGLTLSNNWGDMIRLLDICLVNGLPLTAITSATVDAQGDINLTLFAAHNCLLFQTVELSGFAPSGFNGKYRIKGTPTTNTLILKAEMAGQTIATTGTAKLASLGYEIKFRDINDVKRAYRAIDPTDAHPFIRVDESLSGEGGGTYDSTYAKSAMVGLIENMTSIDDYADTSKLQLPLDTSNFTKNWKIVGTGESVVRGWSRWYWQRGLVNSGNFIGNGSDSTAPPNYNNRFTLTGNRDAFYLLLQNRGYSNHVGRKILYGAGLINSALDNSVIPNWFLSSTFSLGRASSSIVTYNETNALVYAASSSYMLTPKYSIASRIANSAALNGVLPDYSTGYSNVYSANTVAPLEIPVHSEGRLLATLKHIAYSGKNHSVTQTTSMLADNSMYSYDSVVFAQGDTNAVGGLYFYLGELE